VTALSPAPIRRAWASFGAQWLACWLVLIASVMVQGAPPVPAAAQRSVSSSKQFLVFSPDMELRQKVANFTEEVKGGFLQIVGEPDRWRAPILITLNRATAAQAGESPARFDVLRNDAGFQIEIDVRIGDDPAEVNLQKLIVRALYVEFAYRLTPDSLVGGKRYAEAPWWLVEGTIQALRHRDTGPDAELFQRIIDVNHLPPLDHLLGSHPADAGSTTAAAVDGACALCLLELLLEQPDGHAALAGYVRHLPTAPADPVAALRRDFPDLAGSPGDLQKWWTLNLARLSAADRYKGLSPEETDSLLSALLQFEISGNKGTPAKVYGVADFPEYLKLTASRSVLTEKHAAIVSLSARANPLYAEIMADYEQIFSLLARGKTHGVKDRLAKVVASREFLLHRKAEIADYLNWYEATQTGAVRGAFEGYMRVARELATPLPHHDPVSKYLDEVSARTAKGAK
jgi:hypothetical protein